MKIFDIINRETGRRLELTISKEAMAAINLLLEDDNSKVRTRATYEEGAGLDLPLYAIIPDEEKK